MDDQLGQSALDYHRYPTPGKISITPTKGMTNQRDLALAYSPWMANFSENAEDIDPRLQGTAWGLFAFVTKAVAVIVLIVAPLVVAAAGWSTWLVVSLVCLAAFGIAILFFEGPWRRRDLVGTAAGEVVLTDEEAQLTGRE